MFRSTFQSGVISVLSPYGSHPLQLWDMHVDPSSDPEHHSRIRRIGCKEERNPALKENGVDANQVNVGGPSIELSSTRISQNYIVCPPKLGERGKTPRPSLGITLPYLYLTIYVPPQSNFSFEVTILDDKQTVRRFRASTYQSSTVIKPDICLMPLKLERQRRRLKRDALLMPVKKQKMDSIDNANGKSSNLHDNESYYGPGSSEDEDDDSVDVFCDSSETSSCWNRLCIPLSEYVRRAYGTAYAETMQVQIHANCQLKRVYFSETELDEDDELPREFRLYHHPSS